MKNINKALVDFHSKLKPISKDAQNPFFKSDYLTLSGILDEVRPLLASCGLALMQPIKVEGERNILITRIIHESGEEYLSEMILPQVADAQKFGSLITYYKRYQLQAMLGVSTSDEDDDGNQASGQDFKKAPAPKIENIAQGTEFPPTEKQKEFIKDLCSQTGKPYVEPKTFKHATDLINRLKEIQVEDKKKGAKDNTFKI
jgi:hypothetical protein